jgi:hypothetical protein
LYVILYTGSRDLKCRDEVYADLDSTIIAHPDLRIRVGDCRTGLDAFVTAWAKRRWGARWWQYCKVYQADWATYRKAAGPKRNQRMVDDGAAECRAWYAPPPALNDGTSGCVKLASKAGIPVVPYGHVIRETPPPVQEALPL